MYLPDLIGSAAMVFSFQIQKLFHIERVRWIFLIGVVAMTYISLQSLLLPYGKALRSMMPKTADSLRDQRIFPISEASVNPVETLAINASGSVNGVLLVGSDSSTVDKLSSSETLDITASDSVDDVVLVGLINSSDTSMVDKALARETLTINALDSVSYGVLVGMINDSNTSVVDKVSARETLAINASDSVSDTILVRLKNEHDTFMADRVSSGYEPKPMSLRHEEPQIVDMANITLLRSSGNLSDGSAMPMIMKKESSVMVKAGEKKRMKSEMPPKSIMSIDEMNHLLVRHRRSSRSMRPRWSSSRDQEIFSARLQVENAPMASSQNQQLHAPLFRNVSQFTRSYELMEKTLKVYVYKDGNKPIFHQPILKGLYASEGWFMKLMEGNKRFSVKDPRKAHLFYMPFSSRMLEHHLYVRNSHNRTNLRQYLKEYTDKLSTKYPYWNRTGGADHFLVACHDWAPYETRHHMEQCIKALCNADVTVGFKIGRDISLPETYVRSARNPLRDLGGKPPWQRHILAFYAGNLHGYVRPILLNHWKDKDPDMKILGPMPPGVASKMSYIQYMKSSKYCICPKGYEVNSPRVVEAIFYECVPVIISDNFVPAFFEVLNWEAFSIILAEKDIPTLKDVLASIPEKRYLEMQEGVRKIQQHFLWHAKPVKYDLFHMTLHSIWYNRVHQIKLR